MKWFKTTLILVLVLSGIVASGSVLARGHGGFGGHGGAHFGVFIGGPAFWPGYYYPRSYYYPPYYPPYYPAYYPPAVAAPYSSPTYVEQGGPQAAPAPAQGNWWYYCADAKAYYPYAKECPAGWQRVAPQPAS